MRRRGSRPSPPPSVRPPPPPDATLAVPADDIPAEELPPSAAPSPPPSPPAEGGGSSNTAAAAANLCNQAAASQASKKPGMASRLADALEDAVLGPEETPYEAQLREEQKALEKAEKERKKAVAAAQARTEKAKKKHNELKQKVDALEQKVAGFPQKRAQMLALIDDLNKKIETAIAEKGTMDQKAREVSIKPRGADDLKEYCEEMVEKVKDLFGPALSALVEALEGYLPIDRPAGDQSPQEELLEKLKATEQMGAIAPEEGAAEKEVSNAKQMKPGKLEMTIRIVLAKRSGSTTIDETKSSRKSTSTTGPPVAAVPPPDAGGDVHLEMSDVEKIAKILAQRLKERACGRRRTAASSARRCEAKLENGSRRAAVGGGTAYERPVPARTLESTRSRASSRAQSGRRLSSRRAPRGRSVTSRTSSAR